MSVIELCHDLGVSYQTQGDAHCRRGWVNMRCPFCRSTSLHLGINVRLWYANCWHCGHHRLPETLALLSGQPEGRVRAAIRKWKGRPGRTRAQRREANARVEVRPFRFPSGTGPLVNNHRRYLRRRNFDPDQLAQEWGLLGTGPFSHLDKINYRFRLVAPIHWDGEVVSFQTRDVTGRSRVKYMACPPAREAKSHKDILYGQPKKWGRVGIGVEGITDVWRLGPMAFATFGVQLRHSQVLCMVRSFDRVILLFDPDGPAQERARVLAARLRGAGVSAPVEDLGEGDPGSLSPEDARHLVRDLTRKYHNVNV